MPADLTQDILNSDVITLLTRSIPNPELTTDTTANDSDKTFTVPSNQIWHVQFVHIQLATTATVGNRQMDIAVRDDSNAIILLLPAGTTQAASLTRYYAYFPTAPLATSFISSRLVVPLPPLLFLPAGYNLRVHDNGDVDLAADDMTVQIMNNRYDV